ncbi:hypothetical protein ACFPM0_31975 [Pseudonocardia sulfidoxydans]
MSAISSRRSPCSPWADVPPPPARRRSTSLGRAGPPESSGPWVRQPYDYS